MKAAVATTAAAVAGSVLAEEAAEPSAAQGGANATPSWQVGRVKITRIIEMELPVPAEERTPRAFAASFRVSAVGNGAP